MSHHLDHPVRRGERNDNGALERFEFLYRLFFRRLVRDLRRRVPSRAVAEDLAQETLLRAFVKLHLYDPSRPLWPWVRGISQRILADHAPRLGREIPVCPTDAPEEASGLSTVEDRAVLSAALSRLTPRHRLAMGLRYVEDREPREAAAYLGVSLPAFNQLLFRARERLRDEYQRLTDGIPAVAGLRWLRSLARRAQRGGADASRFGEPIGKAASAVFSLVLVFGTLPLLTDRPPRVSDPEGAGSPEAELLLPQSTDGMPPAAGIPYSKDGATDPVASTAGGADSSPEGPAPGGTGGASQGSSGNPASADLHPGPGSSGNPASADVHPGPGSSGNPVSADVHPGPGSSGNPVSFELRPGVSDVPDDP